MRIHLIKKQSIEEWMVLHARARVSFNGWLSMIKYADWNKPADILDTFSRADILGNGTDRVVFDVGGNRYRIICKYRFGKSTVHLYIKWIGTHAEYTKLCDMREQFTISDY